MLVRIDPGAATPLHAQIGAGIRRAIAQGEVADGHRLPSARELAEGLQVNVHTVLRAYAALRDENLIELRRGRGAVVRAGEPERARLALAGHVRELVEQARRRGVPDEEVVDMVRRAQC
jgi:DNA-binding transcriptional regulator YhcF (GntR family)